MSLVLRFSFDVWEEETQRNCFSFFQNKIVLGCEWQKFRIPPKISLYRGERKGWSFLTTFSGHASLAKVVWFLVCLLNFFSPILMSGKFNFHFLLVSCWKQGGVRFASDTISVQDMLVSCANICYLFVKILSKVSSILIFLFSYGIAYIFLVLSSQNWTSMLTFLA